MNATRMRMTWMDTLRGSAIVLVILWHSAAILLLYDLRVPRWLILINETMAPYRMPSLMFLSGMLLNQALAKPLGIYLAGKVRHIAWPWFVWSLVNLVVVQPAGGAFAIPTWVFSYLWFLAYIMSFYMLAPALRWLPPPAVALAFALLSFLVSEDANRRRYCFLAVFFFLGQWASEHREALMRVVGSSYTWLLAPIAMGFGIASAVYGPWRYQVVLIPFSLAGIVVAIKWATTVDGPRTVWIQFVGRNSLIFYVTHFPVIVIIVHAGTALGVAPGAIIPAGLLAALATGTVATRLAASTPVRWLFEIPRGALAPERVKAAFG